MEGSRLSDVQIIGPGGVKATLHEDGSISYPQGAGPTGRRAMGGMPPLPHSMSATDDEVGVGSGPRVTPLNYEQETGRETPGAPHMLPFLTAPTEDRSRDVGQIPRRPDTELEADPLLQEGIGQALAGSALHMAGYGLGRLAGRLAETEGGQAAKFLAERGEPISPPARFGVPKPDAKAVEELQALRRTGNLPKGTADAIDAELSRMGIVDPEVARAQEALRFQGPHGLDMGMGGGAAYALLHAGHAGLAGLPALTIMAARNAAPLVGRVAIPAFRAAETALPAAGLEASPLLQAVGGRQ